ncbi:MAG: hypothetical protein LBI62_01550 [Candidatus Accumulibacter sp.]|nr:hypothetical protein [Accumulibacter sp.]
MGDSLSRSARHEVTLFRDQGSGIRDQGSGSRRNYRRLCRREDVGGRMVLRPSSARSAA